MSEVTEVLLQTTLKNKISCSGVGLHTGRVVNMTLCPAAAESGIIFKRSDVTGKSPFIQGRYDKVTETRLGTTVSNDDGVKVSTVEHLLSALSGCGVNNVIIDLDGPEIPVMDGSAAPFVFLIECAGLKTLQAPKRILKILKTVRIEDGDKFASLSPGEGFEIQFEIDFDSKAIGKQMRSVRLNKTLFKTEIARARTFGFTHEVEALRKAGLALGGSADNAVVIDHDTIVNPNGLRYQDEFVRHKILDAIGDLYLAGGEIQGVYTGYKSGHTLNNALLRKLFEDRTAYEFVKFDFRTARARYEIAA